MRKFLILGTTSLALAFGAVSANAQSVQNRPQSSPYALQLQEFGAAPAVTEGRSAFTSETRDSTGGPVHNGAIKNAAPAIDTFR